MPGTADTRKRLVIVESPAKAKTIGKYLGPGFEVKASVGHIRDLPNSASEVPADYKGLAWASEGIDVDNDFAPLYVVAPDKKSRVADLKRALAQADELLLATDEDREGEAIAWHLREVLKPKIPVSRMVFHEITPDAITAALNNTRQIDAHLVDAQETRRIVDRLVGYRVSPVLWRKIGGPKLSAGRVQSVALRLVVERERERIAFTSAEFCDVRGLFEPGGFPGTLTDVGQRRIAASGDFDDRGVLKNDVLVLSLAQAEQLAGDLAAATFTVDDVKERPKTVRPRAPFTTSTLQQAAGGRLRWSADRTMKVAQGLYERGYITYMRTDSTQLSQQAISAARSQAAALYGADHVAPSVRTYPNKTRSAQEAHEAIRPAGEVFRTPAEVSGELRGDEFILYDLIWKRTVASQMIDGRDSTTTVQFSAPDSQGRLCRFRASGTVTVFAGFRAAYADPPADERPESEAPVAARLPQLAVGDSLTASELEAKTHRTTPPARYTEATLIKELEELGVGRPSTYAATISTIQSRGYVWKKSTALVPSFLGMAVTQLLERHFSQLVDFEFTRRVEDVLDAIARGDEQRLAALTRFYRGGENGAPGLTHLVGRIDEIDPRSVSAIPVPGSDIMARVGRYGTYLERESDGKRANIRSDIVPDELTAEVALELIERGSEEHDLGRHPETGLVVLAKEGRYGPYVQEALPEDAPAKAKPRTASLFKAMALDTVTLDQAVQLLSLPRVVGVDPDTGEEITAQNGRYGPYLRRGTDSRTLAEEAQLLTITLEEALAIYQQPKRGRGAAAGGRLLGEDPQTGRPIEVKSGRFGPYITDGEYNVTLRGDDPETLTLQRAAELVADRRAAGPPATKRAAKKTAAKKTAAKKTAPKKTAAKKTAPKKTGTGSTGTGAKKAAAKQSAAPAAVSLEASEPATAPWV